TGWRTTPPTSFTFSGEGAKTAYAWTKDAAGNVSASRSAAVTIKIPVADVTPPIITFISPTSSYIYSSALSINVSATDNAVVTKMELYLDGALRLTTKTSSINTKVNITKGAHVIIVKAYDSNGNVATSSKTVNRFF
ncbi:MAG: hypothetical protein HGB35_07565, partial [Geobacteraceae bacterium]|nr:hypothetical protein [Geobacteraceae bacterium]